MHEEEEPNWDIEPPEFDLVQDVGRGNGDVGFLAPLFLFVLLVLWMAGLL